MEKDSDSEIIGNRLYHSVDYACHGKNIFKITKFINKMKPEDVDN